MPVSQLNAREIDLFNLDHLKRLVLEIDNEQNRARKRKAWVLNQCKEGNQREYVREQLKKLYPMTHQKFRVGDINLAQKIDFKLNKAYKNQPIRKCKTATEDDKLEDIYDNFHFGKSFSEADSIFNLHKYVCLWLTWQNPDPKVGIEEGSYILHALKPYEYDLVRDQVTGEPIIFAQNYPESTVTGLSGKSDGIEQTISESQSDTSANTRIYTFWNKTQYAKVIVKKSKGHGNREEEDDMALAFIDFKPNVIKKLPIVYLQSDTAVDYPISTNLAEQSIDWNVAFSDLKTAAASQGHGQLVIKHPAGQKYNDLHMGMHTAISLAQSNKPDAPETDAKYISASPDLAGQLDVLKFDIVNLLDDYGIKAKGALEGGVEQFSSGFDRLLSEADVQDKVENNQSRYATTLEQGVFSILKAYELAMFQNTFGATDKLNVTFEKPKVLISDKETLENIEKREALGLILPFEKHMIINPNLTESEAKKREEEIQALAKARREEMIKEMQDTEGEEEDEEEKPEEVEVE